MALVTIQQEVLNDLPTHHVDKPLPRHFIVAYKSIEDIFTYLLLIALIHSMFAKPAKRSLPVYVRSSNDLQVL